MTNGQKIQKIVNKYFKVYKSLSSDPQFKEKASELAKHDLWMLKFVYEQAISELTERIMKDEQDESAPATCCKECDQALEAMNAGKK